MLKYLIVYLFILGNGALSHAKGLEENIKNGKEKWGQHKNEKFAQSLCDMASFSPLFQKSTIASSSDLLKCEDFIPDARRSNVAAIALKICDHNSKSSKRMGIACFSQALTYNDFDDFNVTGQFFGCTKEFQNLINQYYSCVASIFSDANIKLVGPRSNQPPQEVTR